MDHEERDHIEGLIRLKERRLHELERNEALHGMNTPPEVRIEIDDLRTEIDHLKQRLGSLTTDRSSQSVIPDASPDLAPHVRVGQRAHNLPSQSTPLIGRERQIAEVIALLRRTAVRLLTLIGPGGIGKTRLGIQAAAELLEDFAGSVCFVALAPISDPGLVPTMIAQTLGVAEDGGHSLIASLKDELRDRTTLMVLDNFEQLVDAAGFVSELLAAAPDLKVLVTSRAVLDIAGEHEYEVPPLVVPNLSRLPPTSQLAEYGSVKLFVQRAQAVRAGFALTETDALAVAAICNRLEGLPLAIELAAARSKILAPQTLLVRLDKPLELLKGRRRDVPEHQQTLRKTIEWSYDLLSPGEQTLLRGLAIFLGGCRLDAAEAVCGAGDLLLDVVDGMESLLDKSLLRQYNEAGGETRFTLLEVIREYVLERLSSVEVDTFRRRLVAYYLALAESAEPELTGAAQRQQLARLESEHDNLRAALRWSLEQADVVSGLRLSGALWRFWYTRGYLSEGRQWLEAALAAAAISEPPLSPALRAKALNGIGNLAFRQENFVQASGFHEASLALRRTMGDTTGISISLNNLGMIAANQGDYTLAQRYYEECLTLCQDLGDSWGIASALMNLGAAAGDQAHYARATTFYEQSLALWRTLEDAGNIAFILTSLGAVALYQGDIERAAAFYKESLPLHRDLGDKVGIAYCLEGLAAVIATGEQPVLATQLFAAAAALREAIGAPIPAADQAHYDHMLAIIHAKIDAAAWAAAWARGRALPLDDAIADALR